jgi:hypothetical protein
MKRLAALLGILFAIPALSQDEAPKQDPEPKIVELEFTVGRRPGGVYNVPGFQAKTPLALEGKAAKADELRAACEKALEYILSLQEPAGSWVFNPRTQLRPDQEAQAARNFVGTAGDSMNRVVLTSISCMALRAHQELAPRRIEDAVSRGLEYVVENAPKHTKARYGVWTWSFAIVFLRQEFDRAKDPVLKGRIKASITATAEKLMQNQHAGLAKLDESRARPPADRPRVESKQPDPRDQKTRTSKGGFFGVTPSDDDEIGKEGALITNVDRTGPAGKGGMRAGDRVVEINGQKIESVEDLYSVVDSLDPESTVKVKVLRVEGAAAPEPPPQEQPGQRPRPQRQPGQQQPARLPEDGGWSYYQMGAMSFPTASAVMALMDAKEIGCEIPQEVIDRGIRFVEAMRLPKEGDEDGYAYRAGVTRGPAGDLRGAIGRIAVCELALLRAGKSNQAYLNNALRIFVEKRGELDRVRGYPGNHFSRSFMNAAYYFLYGHYYSGHALRWLKDEAARKKYAAYIQEALIKLQHPEGTWTDHEAWGQLYGTAMAMTALGELKFVTPAAYSKPIASVEAKAPRSMAENEY